MSKEHYYSQNHIFTTRTNDQNIYLKAGDGKTLIFDGVLTNTGVTGGTYTYPSLRVNVDGRIDLATNTNQFLMPDGTNLLPSYSFSNAPSYGLYYGSSALKMSIAGTNRLTLDSTKLTVNKVYCDTGTVSSPSILLYGSTTGLSSETGDIDTSVSGVIKFKTNASNNISYVPIQCQDGASAGPVFTFQNSSSSGMYSSDIDNLDFSAAGYQAMNITALRIRNLMPVYNLKGSVTNPSITFNSNSDTGFYLNTLGTSINHTIGATDILKVGSTVIEALKPISTTLLSLSTSAVTAGTGLYESATNNIDIKIGGTRVFNITGSAATFYVPISGALSGSATLTNGKIWIGNSSNIATERSVSGDITITNAGVVTLADTAVTVGSYNYAGITVDSKGRITAASTPTKFLMPDGNLTDVAYSFTNSTSSGMYSSAVDTVDIAAGGIQVLSCTSTRIRAIVKLKIQDGVVSSPALHFTNETTSGLYRTGAGDYGFSVLGSLMLQLTSSYVRVYGPIYSTTHSFSTSDTTTNIYSSASGNIDFKCSGSHALGITSSAITPYVPITGYQSTVLNSGKVWVGNVSNVSTEQTISGDATLSNAGVLTLNTVNSNVGTYTPAVITVNAKGLITNASSYTPQALTKTDDTNVTLTLGGSPTTALLNATSLTLGWTGALDFSRGGLGNSISPTAGGILSTTSTTTTIISPPATAQRVLLSQLTGGGAATTPAWSLARYPTNTTVNCILYSSSTNIIAELATANSSCLVTDSSGVPSISSTLPNAVQDNITRLGTLATQIVTTAGSVSAPAIVVNSTNYGFYYSSGLKYSNNGTAILSLGANLSLLNSAQVIGIAGSTSNPSFTFTGDTTTGFFSSGTSRIGISAGGTQYVDFGAISPLDITAGTGGTNTRNIIFRNSAGTAAGTVTTAVGGTTTAYNTTSDYRLKKDAYKVEEDGLDRINDLKPIEFTWKSNDKIQYGFFAHQFQKVYPYAVSGYKDEVLPDGTPEYQSMDSSFCIPDLVASIQTLNKLIELQNSKIEMLENKINELIK